jgi:hypothetical protein
MFDAEKIWDMKIWQVLKWLTGLTILALILWVLLAQHGVLPDLKYL